jgi:uncharacterized protein
MEISVFDYADLLTSEQEARLQEIAKEYNKKNISCVFVTTNNTDGKSSMVFSDDFYDYNGFRDDGILFLIDMDNREVYVNTVGIIIDKINDYEVENIIDAGFNYVADGNYYMAFVSMEDYANTLILPKEVTLADKLMPTGASLAFSLFVTLIIVAILFARHYSACKKPNAKVYIESPIDILSKNAIFAGEREEVIHDYYKKQTSSSGGSRSRSGGSSHRSSSGRRHGGGGRRF